MSVQLADRSLLASPWALATVHGRRRQGKKNWRVYLKRPFGGPEQVLAYLPNYTHRVAIANSRIREIDEATGNITITYRDYADGAKIKLLKLSGTEFIRRFSLHRIGRGKREAWPIDSLACGSLVKIRKVLSVGRPAGTSATARSKRAACGCGRRPLPRQVYGRPARTGARVALAPGSPRSKALLPSFSRTFSSSITRPPYDSLPKTKTPRSGDLLDRCPDLKPSWKVPVALHAMPGFDQSRHRPAPT